MPNTTRTFDRRAFLQVGVGVALFAAGLTLPPTAQGEESTPAAMERIRADFSNVRGVNYIASYAPSDVAMWRFYDHDCVDRELAMIRSMGGNSVRVWMAWVVFDKEREKSVEKFRDFLELCAKHQIWAVPILWDSCFGDPLAHYDDVNDWVANPGTERVADPEFRARGDDYVRALVSVGRESPSLLMWDIMNEPSGPQIHNWLEHYCRLVKSADPSHPITIGWAHAASNERSAEWVDVMSYHPYGIFDKNREVWTRTVRVIAAKHGNKPILASEAGGPAWGQRYEECLAFFQREKIGFHLFEAMVGTNRFRNVCGFFHPDGTVRELEPVHAFQEVARQQGVRTTATFTARPGGPGFEKAGSKEVAELIRHWDPEELTVENYTQRETLLRWAFISLAWGGALGEHIEIAQKLGAEATEAQKSGDLPRLKRITAEMAELADKLLTQHGFVE